MSFICPDSSLETKSLHVQYIMFEGSTNHTSFMLDSFFSTQNPTPLLPITLDGDTARANAHRLNVVCRYSSPTFVVLLSGIRSWQPHFQFDEGVIWPSRGYLALS